VVPHLVSLGIGITLAFGCDHMNHHRSANAMRCLERPRHLSDVMAINRAHVGEAELLEHRTHLRHRKAPHALLQAIQFRRDLSTHEGEMLHALLNASGEKLHGWAQPHAVEVGRERSHRRRDRHVVVIENNEQRCRRKVTCMVDGLECHPTGERSVTDDSDALEGLTASIPGDGHPESRRNRRARMASAEMIELALTAFQIAGHTTFLAKRVEIGVTAGEQFVGVSLVSHIPDHPVVIKIQGLVEGKGQFDDTQTWAEMAATVGNDLEMTLTNLSGDGLQVLHGCTVQLIRMGQLAQMHPVHRPIRAIYGAFVRSGEPN